MNRYAGDPYWIEVRYAGKCSRCGNPLPRGARAFYFPKGKEIYCQTCGQPEADSFAEAARDEATYNRESW